ncbi:hypothetical protein CHLNCDRAFT_143716 [Chlorella variabilis]|uniref:DUF3429 domain-containing protein n=1 Tax=Chlorella variabilis TaxID=554065 RepID=E1ZAB0_CHLVA|nr:hypothetical protein CHLNCDRAFT_143716 [Chlorella variabilis]EFN57231.1 hypothetical protein CHLNCDRAFT_143716 [Chlorella variabilis]|eukprot:XP_005849333.1 hypothetical protein CHLNCDRAFT_143716 [Chlorella variabilis]
MLRRAAAALARRHEALLQDALTEGQPACWRALQQTRALHPSAAAQLAEQPPSSSGSAQHLPPGATESVVVGALSARAAKAAQQKPSTGVPAVTKFLGFSGALPFWVFSPSVAPLLPLDLLLEPSMLASTGLLQVGYGATILSFLGGVHWGLAMTNVGGDVAFRMADQRYLWSVLPCLMAWPTVAMPAMLLGVVYAVDRAWAKKGLLPPWYIRMRLPLTCMAAGGLVLTAATS